MLLFLQKLHFPMYCTVNDTRPWAEMVPAVTSPGPWSLALTTQTALPVAWLRWVALLACEQRLRTERMTLWGQRWQAQLACRCRTQRKRAATRRD